MDVTADRLHAALRAMPEDERDAVEARVITAGATVAVCAATGLGAVLLTGPDTERAAGSHERGAPTPRPATATPTATPTPDPLPARRRAAKPTPVPAPPAAGRTASPTPVPAPPAYGRTASPTPVPAPPAP